MTPKPRGGYSLIDPSHTLARGLLSWWMCDGSINRLRDYGPARVDMTSSTGITAASLTHSRWGRSITFPGTAANEFETAATTRLTLRSSVRDFAYTIACRVRVDALQSNASGIMQISDSGTVNNGMLLLASSGILQGRVRVTSANRTINIAGAGTWLGEWHTIVLTCALESGSVVLRGYLDGVLAASGSFADGVFLLTAGTSAVATLGYINFGTLYLDGEMDWAACWDRTLTAREAMQLHVDPFEPFARYRLYAATVAAARRYSGMRGLNRMGA